MSVQASFREVKTLLLVEVIWNRCDHLGKEQNAKWEIGKAEVIQFGHVKYTSR